jgi:hypothetical protein
MFAAQKTAQNLVAPLLLCAAAMGCREEHISSRQAEHRTNAEPPIANSLEHLDAQPDGSRVYLKNVTLFPVPATNGATRSSNFFVVDKEGRRAESVVKASSESGLWQLIPEKGSCQYSDFGARVERSAEGRPVLSVFKLGF